MRFLPLRSALKHENIADDLQARGLVEHSSATPEQIFAERRTVYLGIDPTADSLHVGHLSLLLMMKRLGEAGNRLVFLVGGGTGMIGDPKEKGERPMLTRAMVETNTRLLERQLKSLLSGTSFKMVNNADWLLKTQLVPFLRDVGKYFTVNDLIKRDIIKKRLDAPDESISYTEFTYSLLQGFDYFVLNEKYGVDLQIGGSDQWTNILSGVDLIRKRAGKQAYAIGAPLITDAAGKKFGKSEGNAVWLDARKTSPFRFYQFWVNLPDAGIDTYLKTYTFLPLIAIDALMELHKRNPGERQAQETLARLVTETVHGPAATAHAAATSDALFGTTPFAELSREALAVALSEAPSLKLTKRDVTPGYSLAEALVQGELVHSKSEARRLIEGRGVTLNGQVIENPDQKVHLGDLQNGRAFVRKGKQGVLILVLK